MNKIEAVEKFHPKTSFIKELYDMGYIILSPEEIKKVDSAILIADIHGMNPFKKSGQ